MINPAFMVKVFNNTVKGLRDKTEVWCHTCWGNPSQQRMFRTVQSYRPALELLNQVDADVITFEMKSSGLADLEDVGRIITGKKVAIGAIDHHTLQVESPEEAAEVARTALRHIPAERLILSSDCGMGREGCARGDARCKFCHRGPFGRITGLRLSPGPGGKGTNSSYRRVTDEDGDAIAITADTVFQDEHVLAGGTGSGHPAPDATLSPLRVRAERNGNPLSPGDGRVYHITFTADDDQGGSCTGVVTVCVPHDRRPGGTRGDGGPLVDSLVP